MSVKISVVELIGTLTELYAKNPGAKMEIEIAPNNSYAVEGTYYDKKTNSIKIH
jgi:hypothetical protein